MGSSPRLAIIFPQSRPAKARLCSYLPEQKEEQRVTRNITAIIAILLCTTAAWTILGATIMARTYAADSDLQTHVASSWGKPQTQTPPMASTARSVTKTVEETVDGKHVRKTVRETLITPLPIEQNRIEVNLHLEQRQKGL